MITYLIFSTLNRVDNVAASNQRSIENLHAIGAAPSQNGGGGGNYHIGAGGGLARRHLRWANFI